MSASAEPLYVCGHGTSELERLEAQGAYYEDITRVVLRTAGLAPGMRVLDMGCGGGDVSFLAAELVGPQGSVLGVDRAPEAIGAARARAAARGLPQVEFRSADVAELRLETPVDALVGRFVLMHQADPARTLRAAACNVRPGGHVALLESHLRASLPGVHSHPHAPTYDLVVRWMVALLEAAGAHADLGLRLGPVFREAGLSPPRLWLQACVEGGPDAAIYRYMAESVRSMRPQAERLGLVPLPIPDADLERQLREEVVASGGVLASPLVVGAWCRLA